MKGNEYKIFGLFCYPYNIQRKNVELVLYFFVSKISFNYLSFIYT